MISRELAKVASALLVMLPLQGCLNDSAEQAGTKSADNENKTAAVRLISEDADFSVRKAIFSKLTTQKLCQIAIEIEGTVDANALDHNHSNTPSNQNLTPFRIAGDRVRFVGMFGPSDSGNNSIAMHELEKRHEALEDLAYSIKERQRQRADLDRKEQQQVLLKQRELRLKNLTLEGKFKELERQRDEDRKLLSNWSTDMQRNDITASLISPDKLCGGTFEGKAFSMALIDASVRRKALERQLEEQRKAEAREKLSTTSRAPTRINCTSTRVLYSIHTSCY